MLKERAKYASELLLRCLLLGVIDLVLAQRLPMSTLFVLTAKNVYLNVFFLVTWWLLNACAFVIAFTLLFIRAKYLADVFLFALCSAILWLSFALSDAFVQLYHTEPKKSFWQHNYPYIFLLAGIQFVMTNIYIFIRTRAMSKKYGFFSFSNFCRHWLFILHILFHTTVIFYVIGVPGAWLEWLPSFCGTCMFAEIVLAFLWTIPDIVTALERNIRRLKSLFRNHGAQLVIETQWVRLRVPTLLQTYWICRVVMEMAVIILQEHGQDDDPVDEVSLSYLNMNVSEDKVQMTFRENNAGHRNLSRNYMANATESVLLKGCDGVVPLLGMTTVVSRVTHYIGLFMALLVDSNSEEDKNMGTMCGILFFVLALQTGLTRLEPRKRLIRLYRNFCLLSTAILHFVHSMVQPILMTISSSRVTLSKHLRVLSMCVFLMVFPVILLYYLWQNHALSPWLLAVSAFSIEIVIKVVISLLIYTLFLVDSHRDVFWEKLDDYIYYIKATGNTIEFLFGIFLFCNGAWIMLFESGGMIRAVMMCIHAYFNIWMQARDGWKVFIQRRSAVHKINSLPSATPAQLSDYNDVCAICFQDLESARVTRCRHLFHSVCLRKWLYHQDRCPMCHESIYGQTEETTAPPPNNNNGDGQQQQQQQPHPHQE